MRGAFAALDEGKLVPYATAAFRSLLGRRSRHFTRRWLADIATRPDWSGNAFSRRFETPACKTRLRAATDELIARGGFGSPTMFAGDQNVFRQRPPAARTRCPGV